MDASGVATIAMESGKKFDILLRWSAPNRWRRLGVLALLGALQLSVYCVLLFVALEQSRQEGGEIAARYERAQLEDALKEGIETAEQCMVARKSGSSDADIHCPVADRLYAGAKLGIFPERREQVMVSHAYSAMVLDYRHQLRRIEMTWARDQGLREGGRWIKVLVSPVGVSAVMVMLALLHIAVVIRIEQLARAAGSPLPRQCRPDLAPEDAIVGDVPNLPHERIHHPDRR